MNYRDYFDIDPDYFPQVDKEIIETQPDLWKKFYPHPSFVSLLKATVSVLKRKQKLSLWVDGAYGTGKSHAVLTLKKLLEASEEDTKAYFNKYGLDNYLCAELTAQKSSGNILVCHRYGSSDISNDTDLIVAIQEGIEKALKLAGIDNKANTSLKDSLIRYFENEENSKSFDIYASGTYRDVLGGDKSSDILAKLKSYDDDALRALINKIFKVQAVRGNFSMNTEELCNWIREVIEKNNLKELVFIWDEFSEYFENNMRRLTGFQQIAELAATASFCLMIVSHKAEAYFSDNDPDKRKILDRFINVSISLPENIAFELMAQAMKVTDDADLAAKWERHKKSLNSKTMQSRNQVKSKINLSEQDLSNVLPIHPYAALVLQHISIYYTSTARSMFNFIKNDEGENIHAFQWFIDNYGFTSQNPFLTIDMLWSFFFDGGHDKLASGIKEVLSSFTPRLEKELREDEKRVLKTILLLQAISERMTGNREIFLPNNKNLTLAFEGTDLEFSAKNIAGKLLHDHVVTRTPLTGDVFSYCCKNLGPSVDPAPFMKDAKAKTTKDMTFMAWDGSKTLRNTIELTGALRLRYALSYATLSDFDSEIKKANNPSEVNNKIYAVAVIGRDAKEAAAIKKKVQKFYNDNSDTNVVVIDTSDNIMGDNAYNEFVENYAMALAIGQSDITQRKTYEVYAIDTIKGWSKRIKEGPFFVYSRYAANGERVTNITDLSHKLMEINRYRFPECLERYFTSVVNTMFDANSLGSGANCGIAEETKGAYRSGNEATKLEKALNGAWKKPEYWKSSNSYIAELKKAVDGIIEEEFKKSDRIAISQLYNTLKAEPYGFMPCNLTAFVLGFILKEYARKGTYSYSDNLTTVPLDQDRLATMISEIIKLQNTPDKRYKDKYIVTLTEEERAFNKATSQAFDIPEMYCVSITDTRSRIRERMKNFSFPIWLIEYTLDGVTFKTSKDVVCSLIENYCGIANNQNMEGNKSDNDIALTIGTMCINHKDAIEDLKSVLTKENCKKGMLEYLKVYRDGLLPSIARKIGDGGQYINHLQYKFNSDAANWVWNKDTVNSKIDELIVEYEIIEISNKVLTRSVTYAETLHAWNSKIGQIKVAFSVIKNELGEEKAFFEMLYNLKKSNTLLDSQKKAFLELLRDNITNFKNFMATQTEVFFKTCIFYLDDLTENDAQAILDDDKYGFAGTFTVEPNVYTNKVQAAVKKYKSTLGYMKLLKQWKDLTGTDSPFEWSNKYTMPILCMVPDTEADIARRAFSTINSKSTDDSAISTAQDYISKMSFLPHLNNKEERNKAFRETFLAEYSILFEDIDEVKDYLKRHVSEHPYHWLGSTTVRSRIKTMAQAKYNSSGYSKAKEVIDNMPADQVKEYLKQLIQDNIVVGVEIMKGKN